MKRLIAGMLAYALVFGVAYYAQPAFAQIVASGGGLSTVTTSAPLTGSGTVASPATLPTTANPQINSLGVGAAAPGTAGGLTLPASGQFIGPAGAVAAGSTPVWQFSGLSDGFGANNGNLTIFESGGISLAINSAEARLRQTGSIAWSSLDNNNAASDTNLTRTAAGLVSTNGALRTPPLALASLPVCNAAAEGAIGRQTNSTAACTSGTIATTAGTTHCFVGCNGTNWIQFGF